MWKKEDVPEAAGTTVPRTDAIGPERAAPLRASGERATIGRSITINGEVKGDEDLLIQGRVEGSVNLKQHAVTVGSEGEVKADIVARTITVEGRVEGNLSAEEQVILRGTATLQGNIKAPRVVLEDGSRFRGGVDMGERLSGNARETGRSGMAAGSREAAGTTPEGIGNASAEGKGALSHSTAPVSR